MCLSEFHLLVDMGNRYLFFCLLYVSYHILRIGLYYYSLHRRVCEICDYMLINHEIRIKDRFKIRNDNY